MLNRKQGPFLKVRVFVQFFRKSPKKEQRNGKKGQNIGKFGQRCLKFENILKKGPGNGLVISVEHQQMG